MRLEKLWMREIGDRAERAAARHLKSLGWRVVERNVQIGADEIDLVCVDRDTVVFVEVRFRAAGLAAAAESLTAEKEHRVRRAATAYRWREKLTSVPVRFDLVTVTRIDERWVFERFAAAIAFTDERRRE